MAVANRVFRIEVGPLNDAVARGSAYLQAVHQLGLTDMTACERHRLYFLQGSLDRAEAEFIGRQLLADPVTETVQILELGPEVPMPDQLSSVLAPTQPVIEVTLLPGVTDSPADNLVTTAHQLGIAGLERAATGQRFLLRGTVSEEWQRRLATELFANPIIQRFALNRPILPPFFDYRPADETVDLIALHQLDDEGLQDISQRRRLALDLPEMRAIRDYFQQEGREPSDVELEMLAQTWSEHCVHKSFKATIDYTANDGQRETIYGLLNTYIRAATDAIDKPWVRSAFVDNAGIIAFDDQFDLAFKVETHNHPSALEPFGGANTGVGGVVRDVLGVSARPIANTDILCFGPPELPPESLPLGVLHPRRIIDGVTRGIEEYGNKMGIPTVNGAILHHPGYTANPLVYCGCLGLLPRDSHPVQAEAGDLIVAIGGRTGRDGLRGATFSSMEMEAATSELAGAAVQIGNPIQEKQVQEVVMRARDAKLYHAITDCGAGGFSSAVGEMGANVGARVQLQAVSLKYPGLRPWEIWLSEAQERMVLAVPRANLAHLKAICAGQDVEVIILGEFEPSGRLRLFYADRLVGDVSMAFLHHGIPTRHLVAVWQPPTLEPPQAGPAKIGLTPQAALLALLAHPNIRSKEEVIRKYDHEVQGGTAVKPLTGYADHGPSDAAILVPPLTLAVDVGESMAIKGVALANGICPNYGELDPYAMAWAAIDEALRNVVAVGADPDQVAILDNFCWGNPNLPDRLGALVRCAQGCHDAALRYQTPFISGKDSLNNEYTGVDGQKHAVPGTLLVSALAIVPEVGRAVTMDLKTPGNFLFMVGETRAELGGSHFNLVGGIGSEGNLTPPTPIEEPLERLRLLHQAIKIGLVQACHDCAEGGIAVTLAEMCLAGGVGADVQLRKAPLDWHAAYATEEVILFAESLSRFIVEVRPQDAARFETLMEGQPVACIGVIGGDQLRIGGLADKPLVELAVVDMTEAWRGHMTSRRLAAKGREAPPRAVPTKSASVLHRSPRVLILHANGTNRDQDAALACQLAGGEPEIVHINQLLAGQRHLSDYHMLVIPGGFSYGDDLGAGALWAVNLRHGLGEKLVRFVDSRRPVLGICNGFQVLVKAGILPGDPVDRRPVTLTFNESGKFECRWVYLRSNPHSPCLFTQDIMEAIYCPVAHGEGRLAVRDNGVARMLQTNNHIALTYTNFDGSSADFPANPNGSVLNIAGLTNRAGNVLGLMPHPENHIFPWQHPRWGRGMAGLSGLRLFENGIKHA